MPPAPLRAICFDFDGTLVRFGGHWHSWLDLLRTELGLLHCDLNAFAELIQERLGRDDPAGVTLYDAAVAALRRLEQRLPADLSAMVERALSAYADEVAPLPGAHALLRQLAERAMPLALVSNGPEDMQRAALAASGLGNYFRVVLISGDMAVGVRKPDPRIFTHACTALKRRPESVLMVGDRLGADVRGALSAGLQGVWLDRNAPAGVTAAEGYSVFRDVTELTPWLLGRLDEGETVRGG